MEGKREQKKGKPRSVDRKERNVGKEEVFLLEVFQRKKARNTLGKKATIKKNI